MRVTPTQWEWIDMANLNDAMDTVQHNVRILDEALVRLEGGDEAARQEAVGYANAALEALRAVRDSLILDTPVWYQGDSGPGWSPPANGMGQ